MRWCLMLMAMMSSGVVSAAEPFRMQNLMLLQPEAVMRERAENIDALAAYVKALDATASRELSRVSTPRPTAGFVAVAVRPGGRSRVWLDVTPALPDTVANTLVAALERVPPFQARSGVVVFALNVTLWGAPPTERLGPSPAAWQRAAEGQAAPMEIGDLVDRVWPANTAH
ncbi:hypothetical protein [Xanthomonas sacchari]|uniref:Uncharacterized protein n=1 Tax=Xanthomonas sacchari TaxID=56458 RepID=A0A2P5Z6W7_9XANT|nr:hypothetical protein [Xanthomonas sacchari]MDV0438320.1 hypothetical protein [Xanthomonas sacchari]PPU83988.1 hypothetical protein XsacCFBP4641_06355 [Xanthomonas sacchari]